MGWDEATAAPPVEYRRGHVLREDAGSESPAASSPADLAKGAEQRPPGPAERAGAGLAGFLGPARQAAAIHAQPEGARAGRLALGLCDEAVALVLAGAPVVTGAGRRLEAFLAGRVALLVAAGDCWPAGSLARSEGHRPPCSRRGS